MENMSSKKVFYQRPRRWRNNSISCLDHSISCLENFILDLKINFEFVGKYEEDVVKQVFIGWSEEQLMVFVYLGVNLVCLTASI